MNSKVMVEMAESVAIAMDPILTEMVGKEDIDRAKKIAEAYLKDHRADDDRPITPRWLKDVGNHVSRDGPVQLRDHTGNVNLSFYCEGTSNLVVICDIHINLARIRTRGEFRALCKCYGIRLTEKA